MVPTRKPITLAEAPSGVHSSELQDVSGWFGLLGRVASVFA